MDTQATKDLNGQLLWWMGQKESLRYSLIDGGLD